MGNSVHWITDNKLPANFAGAVCTHCPQVDGRQVAAMAVSGASHADQLSGGTAMAVKNLGKSGNNLS